jgi:hypothetical protein
VSVRTQATRPRESVREAPRQISRHVDPLGLLALQRTIGNQATIAVMANSMPAIQRKFSTTPGPETANRNILEQVAKASRQLGYTWPVMNDKRVHSALEIYHAMKEPKVEVKPKPGESGAFTGAIKSVGTNVSSYDLEYPDPKQKTEERVLTRGELAKAIENMRSVLGGLSLVTAEDMEHLRKTSAEPAKLSVKADFEILSNQTRDHERQHARDHEAVFKKYLVKWDQLMEMAAKSNLVRTVKAKDAGEAEAQLWEGAGGTLMEIAEKIWAELVKRSDNFHATPEGAEARLKSVGWAKDSAYMILELDTERVDKVTEPGNKDLLNLIT